MSPTQVTEHSSRQRPTVIFTSAGSSHPQVVLVDSGSDANLIDAALAEKLGLDLVPLAKHLIATNLDGRILQRVTHRTTPVTFTFPDDHRETLSFYHF